MANKNVLKEFLDFLRFETEGAIQDYNKDRWKQNGRWIYTTPVNTTLAKYPRVHIQEVSSPRSAHEVNSTRRRVLTRVQVSILWHLDNKWGFEQPDEGLQELTERIERFINDNQDKWRTKTGILTCMSIDVRRVPADKKTVIRNNLDLQVEWVTNQFLEEDE